MTSLKVPGELRGTARSERNEGARREKGESLPLGSDRRSRNELRPTSRPDTATGLDVPLITGEEKGRRRIYIQYRERNYVARGQLGQPQLEVNGRTCVANPVVAPRTPSNFFLFLFFSFSLSFVFFFSTALRARASEATTKGTHADSFMENSAAVRSLLPSPRTSSFLHLPLPPGS